MSEEHFRPVGAGCAYPVVAYARTCAPHACVRCVGGARRAEEGERESGSVCGCRCTGERASGKEGGRENSKSRACKARARDDVAVFEENVDGAQVAGSVIPDHRRDDGAGAGAGAGGDTRAAVK